MLLYVGCWPLLAYLGGKLIPAIGSGDLKRVINIISISLAVFLIQKTAQFGQDLNFASPSLEISDKIRRNLFSRIQRINLLQLKNLSSGDISYRLTEDADRVSEFIYKTVQDTIPCTLQIIAVIIYMIYLDWSLTLSTLLLSPLIVFSISKFGEKVLYASEKSQASTSNLASLIGESIYGMPIIRAFAAEKWIENKFENKLKISRDSRYLTMKLLAIQHPVVGFIEAFGILTVLGIGATRISIGVLDSEGFSSFFAALLMLIDPISHISSNFNEYKKSEASINRLKLLEKQKHEVKSNSNLISLKMIKGSIKYKNISFSYEEGKNVLNKINLNIEPGKVIALVGSSGAGKSTLLSLLLKFITPNQGQIYVDNISIKQLDNKSLRSNIAIVQQQPFLFTGSIIENIKMGREISNDDVINSCKTSNCDEFIEKLPNKYESLIAERGTNLSGGQIQRIAIARAIVGNPSILLLDEATSALDADSEKAIQIGLKRAMKNRTVIVIAHKLSTIQEADKIIVLNKGLIMDQGNHIELINKKGIYLDFYEKQILKNT
tara:strand:+ start:402 stop:2051 length:1650 start_codon:yes stop_codon:yes gene_type:complete